MKVLISIITPTFQAGGTLRETLESVRPQYGGDTEHLLLDAGSTDETLEIAKGYPHLIVKSEKDRGIYDGMNKGASLAAGEWLLFLQGDDWLPSGSIDIYRKTIASNPGVQMICGNSEAVKKSGDTWKTIWKVSESKDKKLTVENILLAEPMINARLIRKDAFHRLGGFSLDYSLASDMDFLLRTVGLGLIQLEVEEITYRYRWHSGSSTMTEGNELTERLTMENLTIARKHLARADGVERSALVKWHDRLTVQAAMNALERVRWNELLEAAATGTSCNSQWPLRLIGEVLRSLPGFAFRGFKSKSAIHRKLRENS